MNFKVNSLTSDKTALPFEYYSLPFCQPPVIVSSAENLGEVLRGDRIFNSLYQIQMRLDERCKVVCRVTGLTAEQTKSLHDAVADEYRVNMILDNLPAAVRSSRVDASTGESRTHYERGFPVGFVAVDDASGARKTYVHNHAGFKILFHRDADTDLARIVGFEVIPASVKHRHGSWDERDPRLETCSAENHPLTDSSGAPRDPASVAPQAVEVGEEIVFTYDVTFEESPIRWASRWDTYLQMEDVEIHWFSVVNSAMILIFLSGMVAMIMVRTLRRDISQYNDLETLEEAQEETGWKLVHGDVFRPPPAPALLSVYVGTGVQLLVMTFVTMVFALLGFLSPANRGGLMTAMLMLFSLAGVAAGYHGARMFRLFQLQDWRKHTLAVAFSFPGVAFAVFFVLNLMVWGQRSSGAAPFGTLVALAMMWFGISVPLVFVGSYFGDKRGPVEHPVRTNKIPRQVPPQPWYMHPVFAALAGGVLPFGAVFIELFFILTSMWLHQVYYIFGILSLVYVILVVTCAEIAVVLCYFQLCAEDYHWWWRSFFTSGSSALYVFLYSGYYFVTKLDITKTTPTMMYFAYMALLSYGFMILTGTVGFLACHKFVRAIYGSVKID